MKVNIYYGGRGVLDDPTLFVINRMQRTLEEMRVEVERYNIYECKGAIATLPQTLVGVDGIILATTVEWMGIGGYMQQFLDACWLYGDKEKISSIYMQPVVMSTTYGEREGMLTLENAWEILGGIPTAGLCGYVDDMVTFEMNPEYAHIIEKKAESLYRSLSQKAKGLPTSNQAVKQTVLRTQQLDLTPEEGARLSNFVSDDSYVAKQKADVQELSGIYAQMMNGADFDDQSSDYESQFTSHFVPCGEQVSYSFMIEGEAKPLYIAVDDADIICRFEAVDNTDVVTKIRTSVLDDICAGRESFQRAFLVGDMAAKGDMKNIRLLDTMFRFSQD